MNHKKLIFHSQHHFLSSKMKALIRIFIDSEEIYIRTALNTSQILSIQEAVDECVYKYSKTAYSDFRTAHEGVLFDINQEFVELHCNRKITINPENFKKTIQIMFNYAGDSDWICFCREVDCPGGCGTLPCGCIDVCRGGCGASNRDY